MPIHIQWRGPYTVDEATAFTDEDIDYGLYQIYGAHIVYGADVLLYICKAEQQTFGVRIRQHQQEWMRDEHDARRLAVYLGRLAGETPPDAVWSWSAQIAAAEALLIHVHTPAYNAEYVASDLAEIAHDVRVFNWGRYRDLLPEVSGEYWNNDGPPRLYGQNEA